MKYHAGKKIYFSKKTVQRAAFRSHNLPLCALSREHASLWINLAPRKHYGLFASVSFSFTAAAIARRLTVVISMMDLPSTSRSSLSKAKKFTSDQSHGHYYPHPTDTAALGVGKLRMVITCIMLLGSSMHERIIDPPEPLGCSSYRT